MDGMIYSPVSKMDISLYDEKTLNSMKYHQLLKLSHKYNLRKRWAKKADLVNFLIGVKGKMMGSSETQDNALNEEIEWIDANEIFNNGKPCVEKEADPSRSTFTVEKDRLDDSRATYSVAQTINDVLPEQKFDPVDDIRLTFDVSKESAENISKVISNPPKRQVKMLTIPSSGRTRPTISKTASMKESPLKLSKRSIAIKKPKPSPIKTARTLLSDKTQTGVRSPIPRLQPTPRPTLNSLSKRGDVCAIRNSSLVRNSAKTEKNDLAERKTRPSLPRRKSKSDDSAIRHTLGPSDAPTFRTPPTAAAMKKRCGLPKTTDSLSGIKPITANKMPNFSAIHQRQFEKMDSLDEYMKKKSDRAKKLFGTPIASRPVEKVLRLQNQKAMDDLKEETGLPKNMPLKKAAIAETTLDAARKVMNKNPQLRTQTDVKDKNRSHIHGIRTNKRFELQMKFRNI